ELRGVGEVRSRGDRELPLVAVVVGARQWERLKRLRGGAEEGHQLGVAGRSDELAVAYQRRMHHVRRLDDASAPHDYPDGADHGEGGVEAPRARGGGAGGARRRGRVGAFPAARGGRAPGGPRRPSAPPLSTLDGRRLEGARRRAKRLLFPTDDGELVLLVH